MSLALLAFLFRIGIKFSRGSIICFAVLALASLFAVRFLMKAALNWAARQGRVQGRRVVVIDAGEITDDIVRDLQEVIVSMCARLYGKRSAKNRAKKAIEALQCEQC